MYKKSIKHLTTCLVVFGVITGVLIALLVTHYDFVKGVPLSELPNWRFIGLLGSLVVLAFLILYLRDMQKASKKSGGPIRITGKLPQYFTFMAKISDHMDKGGEYVTVVMWPMKKASTERIHRIGDDPKIYVHPRAHIKYPKSFRYGSLITADLGIGGKYYRGEPEMKIFLYGIPPVKKPPKQITPEEKEGG